MRSTFIVQKAIVVNSDGKLLTLLRSSTAPVNPLTWDLPGGKLEWGENPEEGLQREIQEETGLSLINLQIYDVFSLIDVDGEFWTFLAYHCKTDSNQITLSFEHNEYKWVSREEFLQLEIPPKIRRFVENYK